MGLLIIFSFFSFSTLSGHLYLRIFIQEVALNVYFSGFLFTYGYDSNSYCLDFYKHNNKQPT